MLTIHTIIILSLWLVFDIALIVAKKHKHDYNLVLVLLFVVVFAYITYYNDTYKEYYDYVLISVFTLSLLLQNVKVLFKRKISEYDYYELEDKLNRIISDSELLRHRFISTIELINDGIMFKEEDHIFGTDHLIQIFGLENNEFDYTTFEDKIYKDDLPQYKQTIEKLSLKKPKYTIDYRVKNNGNIVWIKEHGILLNINKIESIISVVQPLDIKQFPRTEIDVLNNMYSFKKLYEEMQKLTRLKQTYYFVIIELTSIPNINEKYGRDVGDLMIGEYLTKLRYSLVKDSHSLFRITGIKFGLIIKDEQRYEIMKRALEAGGDLLNFKMIFGGITQTIYPNMGISEAPYESKNPDLVYEEAEEALRLSKHESSTLNYYIHK